MMIMLFIMINCTVAVTYCNKKFVATNYSNNIFCYNKVFLIIIKIFYCNKTLLPCNFTLRSLELPPIGSKPQIKVVVLSLCPEN